MPLIVMVGRKRISHRCNSITICSVMMMVLVSLNLINFTRIQITEMDNFFYTDSHLGTEYIERTKRKFEDLRQRVDQLDAIKMMPNISDSIHEEGNVIWMYWAKGFNHLMSLGSQPGKYKLDSRCVEGMKYFHRPSTSNWVVKLLDSKNIGEYAPTFYSLIKNKSLPFIQDRLWSDVIRLELLSLYGGIWADTSVCPLVSFDQFISKYLDTGRTSFYAPVIHGLMSQSVGNELPMNVSSCHVSKTAEDYRTASTWFMAVSNPHNPLIEEWLRILIHHLTTLPNPNEPYYISHCSLTQARMYNKTVDKIWRSSLNFTQNTLIQGGKSNVCFDSGSLALHQLKTHCALVKKPSSHDIQSFILGEYMEGHKG